MYKLLLTILLFAGSLITSRAQSESVSLSTSDLQTLYSVTPRSFKSVHDPSIVWDAQSHTYYIYGSHYAGVKSKDLLTFTNLSRYYAGGYDSSNAYLAFRSNPSHLVERRLPGQTAVEQVTLGSFDAGAFCATYASIQVGERVPTTTSGWVSGDQWAPDIVYNPNMKKWCYYLSLNGDYWSSVIVLMTSDSPEGPFKYEAPIVFGGFDGQKRSGIGVDYKKTDLELVLGPQTTLPSRYQTNAWGNLWPNCIDPCAFFDEEGELWLAYGSWSGGIFMLKLDKNTGLRDYTTTYESSTYVGKAPNGATFTGYKSDPYFGKLIAGGCYVSGEGPYIQHIGSYYYLFMSYGGFAPDGGYEMRVFRSENPTGPYVDASGVPATYTSYQLNYGSRAATNRGMKLIGAMNNWGLMKVGECAQGHNSVCQDDKGRTFLVCHTKFNDGSVGHQVRIYQLYMNQQGWLCTAPFQYNGETTTDEILSTTQPYSADEVAGDYHVLIHPYRLDHTAMAEATPSLIHLSSDGKVTGDMTGSWKYQEEGKSYIRLVLGSHVYDGVVTEQTLEGTSARTLCFTTVCSSGTNSGVPCWGYKLQPQYALSYNYQKAASSYLKSTLYRNISSNKEIVFDTEENVQLTWTSSEPELFSSTGKYRAPSENTPFTLTARLESGNYYWEQDFNATAIAPSSEIPGDQTSGLMAYYNFDDKPTYNVIQEDQVASYNRAGTSTDAPILETDNARFGQVAHHYAGTNGNNSYSRMTNPLMGQTDLKGFTVSLWVKRADDKDLYNALWGFLDSRSVTVEGPRLYLTGNSYIGFNDHQGHWFDINHPDVKVINKITTNEWHLVTYTFSKENGSSLYLDGNKYLSSQMNYTGSVSEDAFDRDMVLNFISSAKYFDLGAGSFWGSAEACYDDLMIYNRELSAEDVKGLNTLQNRVNLFNDGTLVGIDDVVFTEPSTTTSSQKGVYDLTGRPVSHPTKGLYIVNGRKVFLK